MNIPLTLFRTKNRVMGLLRPRHTVHQAQNLFLTPRKFPAKAWEAANEQTGRRIALDNGLSAVSWGTSHRKVLLVHGWESRATQMSGFVDALLERGFQVIALDGPAHGHSAGEQANIFLFSQAVGHAYRTLGPFESVIAHSMGGSAVCKALATESSLSKVVLIASPSSIQRVLTRFSAFIGLSAKNTRRFVQSIEQVVGLPTQALDTATNIKAFRAEGLIIHDRDDAEIPYEDALEIARNWQFSRLITTQGYGHRAIIRQPEVWQQVAEFLA